MGNFNVESTKKLDDQVIIDYLNKVTDHFVTLSVSDVSRDLHIGINQAYDLFEQANFPTIKIGRKTITLTSYLLLKMSKKGGV